MAKYLVILVSVFLFGCGGVVTTQRPNSYYTTQPDNNSNDPLFGINGGALGEDDIERILNHRLTLPEQNRIAVLRLSNGSNWRYYSSDFSVLTNTIATDFIGQLKSSPRVYDASFLPSMLVPEQRTIPFLREASARYQADLLFAYRSDCRTYEKYGFINASETKALCTIEAVLLDVRTGIIPFTIVASNEFTAVKDRNDTNFRETIRKAELEAIGKSLKEAATSLNAFLSDIDTF